MRVLVTGANGHVGAAVVREALATGHHVVAMTRQGADLRGLAGLDVEHRHGEIQDGAAVRAAAEGCDGIIHLAAVYAVGARDVDRIVQPALVGAENVLRAAREVGAARVVHCSSTYAIGFSTEPKARDASHWNERLDDPYAVAKTLSERKVWELAETLDVDVISINPNGVLGPWDYRRTPSEDLVIGSCAAPVARYPGGASFADVRDTAEILCAALTRGTPGERYIVSGDPLTIDELIAHGSSRTGNLSYPSPLPRGVVLPMWRAAEWAAGLAGMRMPLSSAAVSEFYRRWAWFDTTKTQQAFDWQPRPVRETVDTGLLWCVARGWITGRYARRIEETLGPPPAAWRDDPAPPQLTK